MQLPQLSSNIPRITIVGAGAAGCFCAAQLKSGLPGADIRIIEAGRRPLAKLSITGGGRCNISNDFSTVHSLAEVYPRGANLMKRALKEFPVQATLDWFGKRGVLFRTENEGRIFPASDDAMQIVNTLLSAVEGVSITTGQRVDRLSDSDIHVITCGGGRGTEILKNLPVKIETPVPSLFSFNISDSPSGGRAAITALSGLCCKAALFIPGTGLRSEGDLLITDWGFSGPAALKLSSYAARYLAGLSYRSPIVVRWTLLNENELRSELDRIRRDNPRKMLRSVGPEGLPARLWDYLLNRSGLEGTRPYSELGQKGLGRLVQTLMVDTYQISGKNRFRDEFVTCGGVSLSSLNINTLECKEHPGLYFAGEILDVDAITGGFNLQAAWSTAAIVSKSIISKYGT